ncbi:Pol Polyprotein [Phytophthora megakarya]|uniref:Pol Polyprotein n=1 Tax=Phytophthora megakarya TaxID=4795 RepID=A0A225W4J3_9STRA|nr:Pol Polyprotein [Phytophthora megakarya]
MRENSAPGPDGFTANFYQVAPDIFAAILFRVIQHQLERGILLLSKRKSNVCLLHKKGKRGDPGNFRPISFVQGDVKFLSKALAYRLQQVLPSLIHIDQKGFGQGRSLHHQVRFLSDSQHFPLIGTSIVLRF